MSGCDTPAVTGEAGAAAGAGEAGEAGAAKDGVEIPLQSPDIGGSRIKKIVRHVVHADLCSIRRNAADGRFDHMF